jgi:sugar lactone lactonase YvrE
VREGYVLRISPSGQRVEVHAETGGAPLGIDFGPNGALYVANAYLGLQRISAQGEPELLTDTIDGRRLVSVNDAALANDGRVFFTESSSKFGARAYSGTLAVFDPGRGDSRKLPGGLAFANGIALSAGERFVLIAETGSYRVLRCRLEGPEADTTEVVIDNLPGFPDSIDAGMNGRCWTGLPTVPGCARSCSACRIACGRHRHDHHT